jgi:predicted DNA-binding ribbon-helix-helix protein
MKHRRIDIHGHQTSLALEPEYWRWLYEMAGKTGVTIKTIIEVIAAIKNPHRSLASEIRVAISAYFHGHPYPRLPPGQPSDTLLLRSTDVLAAWSQCPAVRANVLDITL